MPRNGSIPRGNKKSGFRLEFYWFHQITLIPNSAYKLPFTEPKKHTWSLLLSNISYHTHNLLTRGHPQDLPRQPQKRVGERVVGDHMAPLIRSWGGGGGGEANSWIMSCFQLLPCFVQYSRRSLFLLSPFCCGGLSRYKKGSGRAENYLYF